MTKSILFIQGGGAGTHDQWDNKLVASLTPELGAGYEVRYPVMPNEAEPAYAAWKAAIWREIASLEDGAIVIGHSIGATILINALAEGVSDRKFDGIFLVAAPFVGAGGWPSEEIVPKKGMGALLPPNTPVYLYHGTADDIAPVSHVDLYAQAIPQAIVHRLIGRNHQLDDSLAEIAADIRALA